MTRVLFACSSLKSHGGIQRFNRNLIHAWRELGAEVEVVSLTDAPRSTSGISNCEPVCVHGAGHKKSRWAASFARCVLGRAYDRYVCGHIHLAPAFLPVLLGNPSLAKKAVLILHGVETWGRIRGVRKYAAGRFGRVIAVSSYTANSFSEQVPSFPADRIEIFPNTISPELPALQPRCREFPDTSAPLRLLSVARLARTERDKGILDVLDAIAGLPAEIAVEYVVVGDGDDRSFLEMRSQELGLGSRVRFHGELSDVELWQEYASADAFVLPSRKEGFGIVFLEAMYFGLVVIGAAEKGTVDVIRNTENGLLVPYASPAALRNCFLQLVHDMELRERLGAAGRRCVGPDGEFGFPSFQARCRKWLCET